MPVLYYSISVSLHKQNTLALFIQYILSIIINVYVIQLYQGAVNVHRGMMVANNARW